MRPVAAAEYTGLSTSMLAKLRMRVNRSDGPDFIKVSGCVLYRRTDLDNWLRGHVVAGEV
ncbi:DNA-binding protein [Tropicimonas sp. IMCC6043]|nr:DNA-binding protein [Tropicimonas sp. IMCC6043]